VYVVDALGATAIAVDMDHWVLDSTFDQQSIIDLCHFKLRDDSSHYLGMFAYRRGWVPEQWNSALRSITEAEYDWARDYKKRMAIFIPHPLSRFADELRSRAANQTDAEADAQKQFLDRVRREMSCMEFQHPGHLVQRAIETLRLWQGGGLRRMSRETPSRSVAYSGPAEDEFAALGHARPVRVFETTFEQLLVPGMPRTACFLVHGPLDFDQDQLVARLSLIAQQSLAPPPRRLSVPIGVSWRGNSAESLCSLISRELGYESCETPARLAEKIADTLQAVDLILEVQYVNRYEGAQAGSLPGFIDEFWKPVATYVARGCPRRLVVFLTMECQAEAKSSWTSFVQRPLEEDATTDDFNPLLAVELPRLEAIRLGEVIRWLGRWKSEKDATLIAERLINETGGHPNALRRRLRDASIWM